MVSQELVQEMQDIREEMDDTVVIGDEDVLSTSSGSSVEVVEAPAGSERPVLTPQIVALWATMMAVVLTVSVWYMQRYGYISTLTPIGGESVYVFKSAGGDSIKVVAPRGMQGQYMLDFDQGTMRRVVGDHTLVRSFYDVAERVRPRFKSGVSATRSLLKRYRDMLSQRIG